VKKIVFEFESVSKADFVKRQINLFLDELQLYIKSQDYPEDEETVEAYAMLEMFSLTLLAYGITTAFDDEIVSEVVDDATKNLQKIIKDLYSSDVKLH
jgi:hypothetical protein